MCVCSTDIAESKPRVNTAKVDVEGRVVRNLRYVPNNGLTIIYKTA
jgi:hypothetical protein